MSKPVDIARRCKDIGVAGSALTDHGNASGAIEFHVEMTKAGLKPILGCEFYVCDEHNKERFNHHLVILAKNLQGWKDLIRAISFANHKDNYYYKPRLTLEQLGEICSGNWIAFSGHIGSHLANILFEDPKQAYLFQTRDEVRQAIVRNWKQRLARQIEVFQRTFGETNFYIEIQLIDYELLTAAVPIAHCLRIAGKEMSVPCIGTPDAHYASPDNCLDHRVLLCNLPSIKFTLRDIESGRLSAKDIAFGSFFVSDRYHIPDSETMESLHQNYNDELKNTLKIADECELYDVTSKPRSPKFPLPEGVSPIQQLRDRCREGWKLRWPKIEQVIKETKYTKATYGSRFEYELGVLKDANLADYFLIVDDIVRFAREDGQIVGAGRGSAAGSLILYLLEVTHVDPIEHELLWDRFYNAGRNTKDRVSYPDVDMDFEKMGREKILNYIRDKYGHDHVAQMSTFGRMQGRSALMDVLRHQAACSPQEAHRITANIPDEAEISDKLQEMREIEGEASIIRWTLENQGDDLEEWCYVDENNRLQGPMYQLFEQAIRLEGTNRNLGKHAAGIVIAEEPLSEICPMIKDDTSGHMKIAMDMYAVEAMGHLKFDVLGISELDKIHMVKDLLYNEI